MQHLNPRHSNRLFHFAKNLNAIHDFLKKSMMEKKQVIVESFSNFKDGITDAFQEQKSYVNLLTLPVNNLLKDLTDMDQDFKEQLKKEAEYCICIEGKMIPANDVLNMPMEENY